jgi:hypothetical protein
MTISAEPLKIALSKIAPLEEWDASWSEFGPRVCWRLFRPSPQQLDSLLQIISDFRGRRQWHVVDNCLAAGVGVTGFPRKVAGAVSTTPAVAMRVSEADASSDFAALASEIEKRLNLLDVAPKFFSEALLTREGLRKSRGPFEDFEDGGQRTAYLIVEPRASEVFEPTKADIMLHFEPGYKEVPAIFADIIGDDLTRGSGRALTNAEADKIRTEFPILWKISDYYEDAYLSPQEAAALSEECVALDKIVSSPKGFRGVDKLSRIARWASEKHYGVLFSAP